MKLSKLCRRVSVPSFIAITVACALLPIASADDLAVNPGMPVSPGMPVDPVQVAPGPTSDNADPAAVAACTQFATVLDGSATYYGDFMDSFEGTNYNDPAVVSSNELGRTALRESAGMAMSAANTAGLRPDIAEPMRIWSLGATKLLLKMGLRVPGDGLNSTATEMNNEAVKVQEACAAAGTHA